MTRLNEQIKALCDQKGFRFRPWEIPPWEADDGRSPYSSISAGGMSWPQAQQLRQEMIAALKDRQQ